MDLSKVKILGGMAHTNGVTFYGDKYSSKAYQTKNGDIKVKLVKKRPVPPKVLKLMEVPLIRGFADVVGTFYINWYFGIVFLLAPILMNMRLNFLAQQTFSSDFIGGLISGFLTTLIGFLIVVRFVTDLTKYHGAEHTMHNLYIREKKIDFKKIQSQDRFHKWCGSNWIIILIIYTIGMFFVPIHPILKILLWFCLYGEILLNQNKYLEKIFLPFRFSGYFMQLFTTSKPKEKHLKVAAAAFEKLVKAEREETNSSKIELKANRY